MTAMLSVEVAYALPDRQWLEALSVPAGSTLLDALRQSSLWREVPGLPPLGELTVGIWGKVERQPEACLLREGDRVEIYRPLTHDPKEARKARAARVRAEKAGR